MDLAKTLVRSVVRAFYETKHILIIDALIIHSALRDDDLAYLISMNIKDLHKMCQKLKEDRLLATHARSELREGQQRPNSRIYYYIDYRQAIDAIKWRVYKIDKDLQGPVVPPSEKKEYFCDHCKAEWTLMEIIDSAVGPEGFLCHRCGSPLHAGGSEQSGGHERSTRMNSQFKFITDLLPKIDSVVVPDNNFDIAFNNKRPVVRDATHQTANFTYVDDDALNRPTAVRGLANTGPSSLSVSIQAGNGPSEEEKAAERAERERIVQQNALPSWMSNSTVTGEAFKTDLGAAGVASVAALGGRTDEDVKDATIKAGTDSHFEDTDDDYFSRLKKQAEEEALKKNSGEDDEDDEDEDDDDDEAEFEDVVQTSSFGSAAATPKGNGGLAPPTISPPRNGLSGAVLTNLPKAPSPLRQAYTQSSLKREAEDASASPTGAGSPSADRAAKKARLGEDGARASGADSPRKATAAAAPATGEDEESDEDEDIEFEDV